MRVHNSTQHNNLNSHLSSKYILHVLSIMCVILPIVITSIAHALAPCPLRAPDSSIINYPACTSTSAPNSCCDITYAEEIFDVPIYLRQKLNLSLSDNPITIQRTARVWTGDLSLSNPPLIVYNGGANETSRDAAARDILNFNEYWNEAIVIYTQATEFPDRDCKWLRPDQVPEERWSPRWPYCEASSDHSDLNYITRVLSEADHLFEYNHEQVYAAGQSAGGFFNLSLMHFMPETFRAFAIIGCYADYKRRGDNDIPAIVAAGQKYPSRPILYMMGESEDIFPWQPAIPGASDRVYNTIRQLTARNGAEVPGQSDTTYLVNLTNDVQTAVATAPATAVRAVTFAPVKPNAAEVVMMVYGGDHSIPPKDAADENLKAAKWIVDFFQSHQEVIPEEPNILFNQGWCVPTLMAPVML